MRISITVEIVKQQLADKETDVFTGHPFDKDKYASSLTMEDIRTYVATLPKEQQSQFEMLVQVKSEKEIIQMFAEQLADMKKAIPMRETWSSLAWWIWKNRAVFRFTVFGF